MYIFDLVGNEAHASYQALSIANLDRQYGFLRSAVLASVELGRPMLSLEVLRALNYHAIACLHAYAGEMRPCQVTVGSYTPPPHYQVPALMEMFIDEVNRHWDTTDPVQLSAFVLWRLNLIHPFVNGNGRTARAACYFVLCLKLGGWLQGQTLLPELIRQNRTAYVAALQAADAAAQAGSPDLSQLHGYLSSLLNQQLAAAAAAAAAASSQPSGPAQATPPP